MSIFEKKIVPSNIICLAKHFTRYFKIWILLFIVIFLAQAQVTSHLDARFVKVG
jgi:hypothetical protein